MPDASTEASAEDQARAYAPTVPGSLAPRWTPNPPMQPLFADDSMAIGRFGGTDATMRPGSTPPSKHPSALRLHRLRLRPHSNRRNSCTNPILKKPPSGLPMVTTQGPNPVCWRCWPSIQQDDPAQQLEIWMTLFDLYRATSSRHDRFDTLAIDFAAQYGRSAPLWFSMPQLGLAAEAAPAAEPAVAMRRDFSWNAPPTVAVSSVAAQASLARRRRPGPCPGRASLPLTRLRCLLADLFSQWADREGRSCFRV